MSFVSSMDKINNINFTGISNIGFTHFKREPGANGALSRSISMVLKDDLRGNDFSEFKTVLKKVTNSPSDYYFDSAEPNILNVECYSDRNENLLMLNGNVLEVKDKTMPLFSYIAKITRKISNMSQSDMVVNRDYVTYEAPKNLIYGTKIEFSDVSSNQKFDYLNIFFKKDIVKDGAKQINDFIQNIMNKYFGL